MTREHSNRCRPVLATALLGACACFVSSAVAQQGAPTADPPSGSLLAQARGAAATGTAPERAGVAGAPAPAAVAPHALRSISMFAIAPASARVFREHDLIEIIVRETSAAKSSQELEATKDSKFNGKVTQWPRISLHNLLSGGVIGAGDTTDLPQLDLSFKKDFSGEGEYTRRDDFTARLTSEVIQVLPNGNLILESRTRIKTDEEETMIKVTGICRAEDVSLANTILSTQLHDLRVEKINSGQLKNSSSKGIFTKALDFLFAF